MKFIEQKNGTYTYRNEEKEFSYFVDLILDNKINFVSTVIKSIIIDNCYFSFIRDVMTDFYIIKFFTDVDLSMFQGKEYTIDDVKDFVEGTDIAQIVKNDMTDGLLDELNKSIDENIEYKTGIHKDYFIDAITKLLNTFDKQVSSIDTNQMMELAQKINGISGELTPDKLVDAYAKSDLFKERLNDTDKRLNRETRRRNYKNNRNNKNYNKNNFKVQE